VDGSSSAAAEDDDDDDDDAAAAFFISEQEHAMSVNCTILFQLPNRKFLLWIVCTVLLL